MNIATTDPTLSTTSTHQLKPWSRRAARTSRTAGRVVALAAVLSLPLVSAAAATAESAPASTTVISTLSKAAIEHHELERAGGHAAQQQSYLDRLKRDAGGTVAASGRQTAFAAQQQAYVDVLAHAAQAADPDAAQFAASSDGDDDGVPVPVAVLLGIGGMALGTGVAVAARRVRFPRARPAV